MELQTNVKTGDLKITSPEGGTITASPSTTSAQPVIGADKAKEVVKEQDLVTRVSSFKHEDKAKIDSEVAEPEFDTKKIDEIKDPEAKKYAEEAYKSFQRGFGKKFQELAELRKQIESEKTKIETNASWTKERIQQELLNNPQFVQAAQELASLRNPPDSGLTDQEYSALTDKEKAQLQQQNQRINQLEMMNWQMLQKQQDEQLRAKYANYAPDIVDTTINYLQQGKVNADREAIWKVLDYESAVQRAYELGKQDRARELQEKTNSTSVGTGFSATPLSDVPKKEQNETNQNYFKRLAQRRLAEANR